MHPDSPSDPQPRVVEVDGRAIAYTDEGSGEGPVVVAVPGLPGNARDFRWLAPALSEWSRVVRVDPPGFGATPRPGFEPISAARKADLVLGLMAELGIERAVLLGHSFGSVVAAHAAAADHRAVSHLVLLAPPGVTAHFPVGAVRVAATALQHPTGRQVLRAPLRALFRAGGFPSSLQDGEVFCASMDSGAADFPAYRRALDAARAPTLIAWAVDDRQVPPRNSAALHEHAAAGPRVAFASGGHNIQKTRALEIAAMIRAFIAS